jgi:large subunit ribosomal protein L10
MSKKVKHLITRELSDRLQDADGVAVISPRGISGNKNNALRRKLHEKKVEMLVVKNTLARRAVGEESKIKGFDALLEGPSAVIFGEASLSVIARLLIDEKKANETIELRGVFFDGEVYAGEQGVEKVSKLPTREEAIAQIVALLLSPGKNLAGALKSPGGKLASVLKTIQDKAGDSGGAEEPAVAPAA